LGARTFTHISEKLLEDLLFEAPDMQWRKLLLQKDYVDETIAILVEEQRLK